MSLPQVVVGAIVPQNDVGMAMEYLGLGATAKTLAAVAALAMIPPLALRLTRQLIPLVNALGDWFKGLQQQRRSEAAAGAA